LAEIRINAKIRFLSIDLLSLSGVILVVVFVDNYLYYPCMEVFKTTSVGANSSVKKKKSVSGDGSFAGMLNEAEEAEASQSVNATVSVNSLFVLQEVSDEDSPKKQAVKNGYDAIEYLDKIRLGLLAGHVSESALKNLEDLTKQWRKDYDDPKLEAIIDDIELRAAVELAKLEMA